MITQAARYAELGWPVFPCHQIEAGGVCSCSRPDCGSPGKHPRTKSGVLDATNDPATVRRWWGTWPSANIGLATGRPSGLYVVDLDGRAGTDEWHELLSLWNEQAATRMARTGSGGYHVYYQMPQQDLSNTAKKIGEHIDSRGSGGYVLLPPSNHLSGRNYGWVLDIVALPLPGWLLELVAQKEVRRSYDAPAYRPQRDEELAYRILREEAQTVRRTGEGSRNHQLFKSATSMFEIAYGGEIRVGVVFGEMEAAGLSCGLTKHEVEATLDSAAKHGRESPRRIRTRAEGW